MNKKELLKQGYEEAVKILAVSFGIMAVSVLFAIGITLIYDEIYLGVILLVLGYELFRVTIKWIWKHHLTRFT